MNKSDAHWLVDRLEELAEALGSRAPGAKAIPVWLDALGDCKPDHVKAVLADWPKFSVKMPAPADVRKKALEKLSDGIESRAAAESRRDDAKAMAGAFRSPRTTEIARVEFAKIKDLLSDCDGRAISGHFLHIAGNSRMDPKQWAKILQVADQCGDSLSFAQVSAYKAALGIGLDKEQPEGAVFRAASDNVEVFA